MRTHRRRGSWVGVPADSPVLANRLTILSDLSANLFAALLLILILLLQQKIAHPAGLRSAASPVLAVDASADLGATSHQALSGAALVDLLRERSDDTPGLGLDLLAGGVLASGVAAAGSDHPTGERDIAVAIDTLAGRIEGGAPVRLYVFDNRWYRSVRDAVARHGLAMREMSVPDALRARSDEGWSPEFLTLVGTPGDPASFRQGLTRLLAGSQGRLAAAGHSVARERGPRSNDGATGSPASGLGDAPFFDFASLRATILAFLRFGAILLTICFVLAVRSVVAEPALGYRAEHARRFRAASSGDPR